MSYDCSDLPPCYFDTDTISLSCMCQDKSWPEERVKEEAEPWLYLSIALTVLGKFIVFFMPKPGAVGFLTSTYWLEYYYAPHKVVSSREPEVVEAEVVGVAAPWLSGEANPNLAADGEANPNLVVDLEANPNLVEGGAKNPPAPSSKVQAEGLPDPPSDDRVEMVVGLLLLGVPPLLVCSWAYAVSKSEDGITGSFGLFIAFVTIVVYVLHSAAVVRWMLGQLGLSLSIRRVCNKPLAVAGLVLARTAVCVSVPGVAGAVWAYMRMSDTEAYIGRDRLC